MVLGRGGAGAEVGAEVGTRACVAARVVRDPAPGRVGRPVVAPAGAGRKIADLVKDGKIGGIADVR
ncbi:hypothetical protein, partial [Streptomyces filamentosus]|uniref:hypothetical protein n=1 Tax=Streptomyces filamentosus TaxID=67294 RepID=UPI00331C319C